MISKILKTALVLAGLATVATGLAQSQSTEPTAKAEPTTKLDSSLVFARGSYGLSTDTDVWIGLVSPTFENTDWRLQATLPFVHLKGPATVVGNTGGTTTVSHSDSGLGDASLALTRKLPVMENGWTTSIGAKVKFPTADKNKGLGTGEFDESLQVDVLKSGGQVTPFATFGYQILGHSVSYPMKSGFFATAGIASKVSSDNSLGLAVNWRERTISQGKEAFETMVFAQHELTTSSHLQIFYMRGFTDASPDNTLGVSVGLTF